MVCLFAGVCVCVRVSVFVCVLVWYYCTQAENSLTTLEGLDELTTLQWVHVRDNKLVSLDGMTSNLAVLQYLNLR